jgi:F0F1-type ATP synthase assembly protein I
MNILKQYHVINTLFALSIYVGFYSGLDALYAVLFVYIIAWTSGLATLMAGVFMFDELVKIIRHTQKTPNAVSHRLDVLFDIACTLALVGAGAYVIAVVYTIHVIILFNGYTSAKQLDLQEQE